MNFGRKIPSLLLLFILLILIRQPRSHVAGIDLNDWQCDGTKYTSRNPERYFIPVILDDLLLRVSLQDARERRYRETLTPWRHPLVYAYANCSTIDHSGFFEPFNDDCGECLKKAKKTILNKCAHRIGGRVVYDVCYMRYEGFDF